MCIITVTPKNTPLYSKEVFNSCSFANPDGFGLMYCEDGQVKVQKTMNRHAFWELLQEVHTRCNDKSHIVAHYRVSTCGDETVYNCHPFEIFPGKLAMAHNGQIMNVNANSKESDSHKFAKYLSTLEVGFHRNPAILELLSDFADHTNILVFMDNKGALTFINKQRGVTEHQTWFSNHTYRPYKAYYKPDTKPDEKPPIHDAQTFEVLEHCDFCGDNFPQDALVETNQYNCTFNVCRSCLVNHMDF